MDISDYSDYAPATVLGHHLSDSFLAGPKGTSQGLIHDHDGFG
jgi:hypothetical protein